MTYYYLIFIFVYLCAYVCLHVCATYMCRCVFKAKKYRYQIPWSQSYHPALMLKTKLGPSARVMYALNHETVSRPRWSLAP